MLFLSQTDFAVYLTEVYQFPIFLGKDVLEIYSKFTEENPYRNVISIKLFCNFIKIALWHGCSPVYLRHIFRTPFPRNTSGWLLLPILHILSLSDSLNKFYTSSISSLCQIVYNPSISSSGIMFFFFNFPSTTNIGKIILLDSLNFVNKICVNTDEKDTMVRLKILVINICENGLV